LAASTANGGAAATTKRGSELGRSAVLTNVGVNWSPPPLPEACCSCRHEDTASKANSRRVSFLEVALKSARTVPALDTSERIPKSRTWEEHTTLGNEKQRAKEGERT
jgi:hypothetical protein